MAAAGTAPIQISLDPMSAGAGTDDLLAALLRVNPRVSDLIFSPGRKFQVQVNGEFVPVAMPGAPCLTADDTRRIASDLIGPNKAAISMLREQGYCDVSYAIPGLARFRVNIFIQRGSCAVVMRVIPTLVPNFKELGLPEHLHGIAGFHDGLVLVTGPRGSGKSSTLAALLDCINETKICHIITIEDPIEFLHNHKRATVHQRELHSDTPSVAHAMRAALRQAPNVIAVGELKDCETMELALEAAETGHLVLSTLNTLNAQQTVERFIGAFPAAEQSAVRERLARMLRCVISQRLIPRKSDEGRVALFEVLNAGSSVLSRLLENGAANSAELGSSHELGFDIEIEKLVRAEIVSPEVALMYATDAAALSKKLAASAK
jgi:twitching motility protein PilT